MKEDSGKKKEFKVLVTSSFSIYGGEGLTFDIVWASQKPWLNCGAKVVIEDEQGNKKVFIKDEE